MMYKKNLAVASLLASVFLSTNVLGSPASTEYVKAAVGGLRNELSTQINTLNSSISTTQQHVNELNNTVNQLNPKTNELSNRVNELIVRFNTLTNKMNDSDITSTNKIEIIQKQVNELPMVIHHLGEVFQGGMVFYVDISQQHGLMVSLNDLRDAVEWRNGEGGDRITNASAQGLGSGETNTRLIISEQTIDQQEGQFAALIASNYQISADGKSPCLSSMKASSICYGGWYLPSIYELVLLHDTLKNLGLGGFKEDMYWSSSENDATQAWLVDFISGEAQIRDKSIPAHIRAIHAF